MIQSIRTFLLRFPLRLRLTILSTFLLLTFLLVSSGVQYIVINQQLMQQEEEFIRQNMEQIRGYFESKPPVTSDNVLAGRIYLDSINQPHQMLRILDQNGRSLITVSDDMPEDWIKGERVERTKLSSFWHQTDHVLVLRSPLNAGSFNGTIEIANNLEIFDRINEAMLAGLLIGACFAVVVSAFGALYLVRQLLRPIRLVMDAIRRIRRQGFHQRVVVQEPRDELSELAVLFNGMMDQVESSLQQQQQFVQDASHELRTPIAIVEGHLSMLKRWGKKDPVVLEESLQASLEEIVRLKGLVHELLDLNRAEAADPDEVQWSSPAPVFEEWLTGFIRVHPAFTFHIDWSALEGVGLPLTQAHLKQLLLIVLDNAVKYSRERKEIHLTAVREGHEAEIRVQDHGIGIPAEDLPYVCRRFYRVDKARSREMGGSGLGLSIAQQLAERSGGTIQIESREEEGTLVRIRFPYTAWEE